MTAWDTVKSLVLWTPAPVPVRTDQHDLMPVRTEQRDLMGVRPVQSTLNRPQWPKYNPATFTREGYARLSLVFRCVQFLSQSVASAPLRIYPYDGDDADDKNPVRQLLTRPNRESNEARWLSQVTLTMATAGFCVVEKERSANGRVIGLWPINPDYCKPIPRSDASPDWEITVPGYPAAILIAEDVLVLTYADRPDQFPTGIGPLEVLLRQWGLLNVMDEFLMAFFQNDALPQYLLIPKPGAIQNQTDADVVREKWRTFTGLASRAGPPIMETIERVERLSFNPNELAYKDLRDITENSICTAFGIPPILVGTSYGLSRSTFANYGEARRSYYEDTISPLWNRIEDAVGRALLHEFLAQPQQWRVNFDIENVPAMRDDVLPRQTLAVQAFQAGGMSSHQLADELGIEPRGPDEFLRSMLQEGIPATVARSGRTITATLSTRENVRQPEARKRLAVINRTAYMRVARKFEPEMQRFFDNQGARVVHQLFTAPRSSQNGHHEIRESLVQSAIDWDAEDRILESVLRTLNSMNGTVAFQLASQTFDDDSIIWSVTNPRIKGLLDILAHRVVGINATTVVDIERVVTESLTEGVTMEELAGRLTGMFEETYQGRSMTIARTESQVAYNQASTLAYRESGQVEQAELMDNPDHTEDYGASDGLSCADRNGLIVDLGEVENHIWAEHPNGTLAVAPYLAPIGDA